ncbi:tyrosine-type recombinase/integrase [Kibdelosporangium lantanae]|uniref:Tyrosine-type recombinase/integrase n=1 Tax=Kibdelosporangium lantanae TaxID=1497396 RepID=A0ABW3M5C4_9PSEU
MAYVERVSQNSWRVRYTDDNGDLETIPGFRSKTEAEEKAQEIDVDRRRNTFINPNAGKLPLGDWSPTWFGSIDVAPTTEAQYTSLINNHILPRWQSVDLCDITNLDVRTWAKKLRLSGYSQSTVKSILKILTMMLADAVDEKLLTSNPIRPQRRGRRQQVRRKKVVWATPEQVVRIALQAARLVGPWAAILIITAAWTGARWGELTGLQRPNIHLDTATIVIDPDTGALHELATSFYLGPPKTADSARTITLPPFLIPLLQWLLASHNHPHIFVSAEHQLLRRSNFSRRAMRPAADGNLHRKNPHVPLQPIRHGLTFHGLRHSHKTWLIADGLPEVAQSERLGHHITDEVRAVYSHVAPEVETRLLQALEQRWTNAINNLLNDTTFTTPAWSAGPATLLLPPKVDVDRLSA